MPRPTTRTLAVVLLSLSAGCAGTSAARPKEAKPAPVATTGATQVVEKGTEARGPRIVCAMERPTGSNIAEEVCRLVDRGPTADMQVEELTRKARVPRGGGN